MCCTFLQYILCVFSIIIYKLLLISCYGCWYPSPGTILLTGHMCLGLQDIVVSDIIVGIIPVLTFTGTEDIEEGTGYDVNGSSNKEYLLPLGNCRLEMKKRKLFFV